MNDSCVDVIDVPDGWDEGLDCFEPEAKADSQLRPRRRSLHDQALRRHTSRAVRGRRRQLRFWQRSAAFRWGVLLSVFAYGLFVGTMLARPATPPATPVEKAPVERLAGASLTSDAPPPVVAPDERGTAGSDVAHPVDAGARGGGAERVHPQLPRARVPMRRGTLMVTSTPRGAAVFLNNEYAGQTPLTMRGVASGSRAVRVALDGYAAWSRGVQVVADDATIVSATLNELNRAE